MTLEEMKTLLKRYGFDEKDPLTGWINAAMHDLEDDFDWPWLESNVETIKVAPKVNSLVLPAEALKVIGIRDTVNLRKLILWDRHRFMREIQEPAELGLPEIYTLLNTTEIQLWRVPETEITFEVVFQGRTPDLGNPTDVPTTLGNVWPINAHYPIVMKAAAIALQAENEEERAKNALDQYDKSLEKLRKKFGERDLDEPQTVTDVMQYSENVRGY
jgi:hypothetical protein